MVEDEGPARRSSRARAASLVALVVLALLVFVPAGFGVYGLLTDDPPEVGVLVEDLHALGPGMGPVPRLADVTDDWGLGDWGASGGIRASGGAAIGDLDADGRPDLVVGGGGLGLFFGEEEGFARGPSPVDLPGSDVTAVSVADVDADGALDVLVAHAEGDDAILWGGPWVEARDARGAEVTSLAGAAPTTGLIAADLTGDGARDVVRLSYGDPSPAADVIWEQRSPRVFEPAALPGSERSTLAGEVADVDGDGSTDVWLTRDVGWKRGGDQVFVRERSGWRDAAPELGADLEVDGMGVVLADLAGDEALDAYVSDIGENDLLVRRGDRYVPARAGVGRVRPPGAGRGLVSSSWAAGVADLNLDGNLDLVVTNGGFPGADVPNKIPDTEIVLRDTPAIFLGDGEGRYSDVWPGMRASIGSGGAYRGLALGDLDGDGDTDVVLVTNDAGMVALRNDTRGASVSVVADPRCPVEGAVVEIETEAATARHLLAQHTFLGAHAAEAIAGGAGSAGVRVLWPDGGSSERTIALDGRERVAFGLAECRG